jgi:hypothetical protein
MRRKANFTQVSTAILRDRALSAGARLLYVVLASYAWQDGACFPDEATLAADLGVAPRTMRRHRDELVAAHLLIVKRRGQGKSNVYAFPDTPETDTTTPDDRTPETVLDRSEMASQSAIHPIEWPNETYLDRPTLSSPLDEDKDSSTKRDSTASAVEHATAQKQTRAPRKVKPAAAKPPSETRLLAECWMKANEIDLALAGGAVHKKYNAWAAEALQKRDRDTLTRFLRWQFSKRRAEGVQYDIVPHLIDERIGQWQSAGEPGRYTPKPDKNAPKPRESMADIMNSPQNRAYRKMMADLGEPAPPAPGGAS